MFDFLTVKKEFVAKQQRYVYYPSFLVKSKIKDLMIRSRDFYAIINPDTGFWITDEGEAIELIDKQVYEFVLKDVGEQLMSDPEHGPIIKRMTDSDNHLIDKWHKFCQKDLRDQYYQLNQKVIFMNSEVKREDYATYKLDYPIVEGETPYYNKLVDTLYLPEEKEKFEWAVGCILAGDQSKIQKLFVFYGLPGSGKSTIINKVIVNSVFGGSRSPYCTKFTAGLLASRDAFGTGFLSHDPVLAFDDDADLSRIEDNTTLNLIVSHEPVRCNEKFKATFTAYPNCILICGTNDPIQLSPNSGLNRRLIDIRQTGERLSPDEYDECIDHLKFERSAIAAHCLSVYKKYGKNHYNHYVPEDMLSMTSPFHNFVKDSYLELKDGTTLSNAYKIYCSYCEECNYKTVITRYKFRDSLKLYFNSYEDVIDEEGKTIKNFFSGFKSERIGLKSKVAGPFTALPTPTESWLKFDCEDSLFDKLYKDYPAQYAKEDGTPKLRWSDVKTTLKDIDTHKVHYVQVPSSLITIDLDMKDENGNKSFSKNYDAAIKFPPTYAELSKSGEGIHLHYIYTGGDPKDLSRVYADNIEVKVQVGNSALRRMLTKCNGIGVAELSTGLPLKTKGGEKLPTWEGIKNEQMLRRMIIKNLKKEYWPATKPSVDYIDKLFKLAYRSGIHYDLRDMDTDIFAFAMNSTHNSRYCMNVVNKLHLASKDVEDQEFEDVNQLTKDTDPIVIFDCEVFPNLFLINWKYYGKGKNIVRMINPSPEEVEGLFRYRLIGFNNRKYDNHILYARSQGYSIQELYSLSQRIIAGDRKAFFSQAYNLSYTDVYDFASAGNKQSLKKWEIELSKKGILGIKHHELGLPWDQPVPEHLWDKVAEYCDDDVLATEATFDYLKPDFIAREILADLSGLTVNDTTNQHTTKILVGDIKDPQKQYVYTDLSTIFPGYEFNPDGIDPKKYKEGTKIVNGKSLYLGEDPGEGGYALGNPGMYTNVVLLDIASMHPHSAIRLNIFGDVITARLKELVDARIAIKHRDWDRVKTMLGGKLAKYIPEGLSDEEMKNESKKLSNALKTAINSVYGLTSAGFDNKLRDPRNVDNIVAKYGALFMITLKHEVEKRGFTVVHIKTDSIKIANATQSIIDFVSDFGTKYGYTFEKEAVYDKMCIVNDAVYVAHCVEKDGVELKVEDQFWTATGTQFQIPYVFKTLFSHEPIIFSDLCETKSVTSALYLDMDENLPEGEHNYIFVGRVGQFTPIKEGCGGGRLLRINNVGNYSYATGTKGYRWLESETVKTLKKEADVDRSYYIRLVDEAVETIRKYGDFDWFVSDEPVVPTKYIVVEDDQKEELPF